MNGRTRTANQMKSLAVILAALATALPALPAAARP